MALVCVCCVFMCLCVHILQDKPQRVISSGFRPALPLSSSPPPQVLMHAWAVQACVSMSGVDRILSVRACGMCAGEEENSAGYRSRASGMERKEFCI
jgi:hypothetical protein